jgi:hypothetical protein
MFEQVLFRFGRKITDISGEKKNSTGPLRMTIDQQRRLADFRGHGC